MALDNFGRDHFSEEEQQEIRALIEDLIIAVSPNLRELSDEERSRYGSINEQNKLLVNKVADYRRTHPSLASPEVDWVEFEHDRSSRIFLEDIATILLDVAHQIISTKIRHDYDNFQAALSDYSYTQYLAKVNKIGAIEKLRELKQFFPRTTQNDGDKVA